MLEDVEIVDVLATIIVDAIMGCGCNNEDFKQLIWWLQGCG